MFGGRQKSIVGLDIGSHSIKAIVLDDSKSGLVLKSLGVANLPPEAIIDGNIENKDMVIGGVKNLIKSQKIKVKNVCTSISGYSVIIKKINLPRTTREELSENIEVEAEQFIPFDISEVNVDFQILDEEDDSGPQMEVILAAAKKEAIKNYMEIMEAVGLKATVVDVDVFALENAFTFNHPEKMGTVALIDIGANKMNINVIKDGVSLLTKDAAMGGARITGEIQDRFDLDFNEAEAIKIGAVDPPDSGVVAEVIGRAVQNWVAESRRTIDFLMASYPGEKLREIFLSGGSSRIEGLAKYFQQELNVPVSVFNPFEKIGFDRKVFDPEYIDYMGPQATICLGLALRRGEAL